MKDNIRLKLEEGTFEEDFIDDEYCISIFNNDIKVGFMTGWAYDDEIYLEHLHLEDEYTQKGYGTKALQQLKEIGKSLNFSYIKGECRDGLMYFYKKLGADFNYREPEDENYILNRFYIDL